MARMLETLVRSVRAWGRPYLGCTCNSGSIGPQKSFCKARMNLVHVSVQSLHAIEIGGSFRIFLMQGRHCCHVRQRMSETLPDEPAGAEPPGC